jgi:hypothetical protein
MPTGLASFVWQASLSGKVLKRSRINACSVNPVPRSLGEGGSKIKPSIFSRVFSFAFLTIPQPYYPSTQ